MKERLKKFELYSTNTINVLAQIRYRKAFTSILLISLNLMYDVELPMNIQD